MPKSRRTRYVVTFANGEEKHILSPSTAMIRDHYPAVRSIRPYRRGEAAKLPPKRERHVVRPGATVKWHPEARYRVLRTDLREAVAQLGVEWPVFVKVTGGDVRVRTGCHSVRMDARGSLYHHITVRAHQSASEASKTLYHELTHARQSEDVGRGLDPAGVMDACHAAYRDGTSYREKTWEREAEANEALSLVRPVCGRR